MLALNAEIRMVYKFDLTADDYIEASLAGHQTRAVLRAYALRALLPAVAVWIVGHDVEGVPILLSTAFAAVLFLGILAYYGLTWRKNFAASLARHYETRRSILGPHTLELTDAGLESSGPLHRSFRAWPSVTGAIASRSHVFIHTLFGIVYVLPLRAVEDSASLFVALDEHNIAITDTTNNGRQT
jgi:hypothetical protein